MLFPLPRIWHQKLKLNGFAIWSKPLRARAPQFNRVWKTGCGDAHAGSSLCKHHGFNDDPDRIPDQHIHVVALLRG